MRVSRGDVTKLTTLDRHWDEGGKTPNPWTLYRYPPSLPYDRGAEVLLTKAPRASLTERRLSHA